MIVVIAIKLQNEMEYCSILRKGTEKVIGSDIYSDYGSQIVLDIFTTQTWTHLEILMLHTQ